MSIAAARPLVVDRQVPLSAARGGSLGIGAAVGVGLFYLFMLMPARLQEMISVVTLDAPKSAVLWGVGYPYFTALDAIMLVWGLASWVAFRRRHARSSAMFAYVGVSLVSAAIAYYRFSVGRESDFYWDGALGAVRLLAAFSVFASVPSGEARWGRRLQDALALLFVMSLLLNLAGFQNRETFSNEAGRLTAAGLDFSTTSYFGAVLALTAVTMSQGRRRQILVAAGLIGVAMGGGRLALVVAVIPLGFMAVRRSKRRWRVFFQLAAGGVAVAGFMLALPQLIERIPTLSRQKDDAVYYPVTPPPTPTSLRYFPFLQWSIVSNPAVVGRFNTLASAVELLQQRQWEPAGSDWIVQRDLASHGVPSHSHNGYLQSALKFGPMAVFVWLPLFLSAWRGLRQRSPYGPILLYLLASLVFDYWMLVSKALFLLYVFAALNDMWLAQLRRRKHIAPGVQAFA